MAVNFRHLIQLFSSIRFYDFDFNIIVLNHDNIIFLALHKFNENFGNSIVVHFTVKKILNWMGHFCKRFWTFLNFWPIFYVKKNSGPH